MDGQGRESVAVRHHPARPKARARNRRSHAQTSRRTDERGSGDGRRHGRTPPAAPSHGSWDSAVWATTPKSVLTSVEDARADFGAGCAARGAAPRLVSRLAPGRTLRTDKRVIAPIQHGVDVALKVVECRADPHVPAHHHHPHVERRRGPHLPPPTPQSAAACPVMAVPLAL